MYFGGRFASFALLLLPTVIAAPVARAQAPPTRLATQRWIIERWGSDQGLPQNTVTAIAQTPDGYLWIGTFGGLARFDGVRFTQFTGAAFAALASNRVFALKTGQDGTLWIGTDRTLVSYRNGEFRDHGEAVGRPPGRSTFMFVDESGVWLTTATGGLGHLPDRDGTFERFTDRGVPAGWGDHVARDRAGNVWLAHRTAGFLVMRAGSSRFEPVTIRANGLTATGPDSRTLAHDGSPIFVTNGGFAKWNGTALERIGIGGMLVRGRRGEYWASDARGIWRVDSLGNTELVERDPATRGAVTAFLDREGALWLGTTISGLVRLRQRVVQMYFGADGLAVEQVTAILRDSRNRLWVGSSCGPTSVMTGEAFAVRRDPGCVFSMAETPDGTLWFGIHGDGLQRIGRDGSWSPLAHLRSKLPSPVVISLFGDADNSVWIGTDGGLAHYVHGEVRKYFVAHGLPGAEIHFITRDRRGALWVGAGGGLARLEGTRFRSWTTRDGLPPGSIRAIHHDADGMYWIGTYGGGLVRFDGERFVAVSLAQGLFDNVVSAILEDQNGNLWMSGNRGIFRANRADLNAFAEGRVPQVRSVGYGPSDGLLTPESNGGFQPSAWQDKDGRLWFATVRGLATIDPVIAAPRAEPPGIVIESFNVDGRPMPVFGEVRLPVGSRYIEIGYTALTSFAPERLVFRHRLDGFDPDWVYANERRTAYYSAPRPGRYTFAVTAAGREGAWNEAAQQFSFVVPAALYQTLWFRVLLALGAVGALAGAVRARIARAQARERLQREFTRHVLHGQEQERGRIAGELHDSLGQDLLIMKTRATLALRAAELPASLHPHIAEIASVATQAVQHAREMSHDLRPHHLDNLGLAASLRDLAEHAGAAGKLLIETEVADTDSRIKPDQAIHLFRIVQESLNNIIKHAHASSVTISLQPDGAGMRLLVSDDGRGMDLSRQKGFGLTGMQQRVHILGGTFALRSIVDAGTTIDVYVPTGASAGAAT